MLSSASRLSSATRKMTRASPPSVGTRRVATTVPGRSASSRRASA
jgi:hypothetical protein